jgi:Holliday junction DNA helicase RuvA
LAKLKPASIASLIIETHVREDHIHLYGFVNNEERDTFLMLQSVKGVGTKMALVILGGMSPDGIQIALAKRDIVAFNNISGIGKKLAERIITELKDKFTSIAGGMTGNIDTVDRGISNDAISALVSLGISRIDAQNRIATILSTNQGVTINELIKLALKSGA